MKRSKSAVAITGAGTPSSIAAVTVQRPSPESLTRPENSASVGRLLQRGGGEVEQPRRDDAAASPHLRDLARCRGRTGRLGVAQRRGLGVGGLRARADVGVVQDVEPLGVRGHERVLDAVVHHLHEVAGAGGSAVQVAHLLGRGIAGAAGRALGRGLDARARARGRSDRAGRPPRRGRRSSGSSRARARTRRRSCRSRCSRCFAPRERVERVRCRRRRSCCRRR